MPAALIRVTIRRLRKGMVIKMLDELKKKSFKKSLPLAIILIAAGIALIIFQANNAIYALTGLAQFEDLAPEEIKNQLVQADLNAVFDNYLEEYSENTSTHRRTTTYLYYITWTGDDYATDYRFITVKVPADMKSAMNGIMDFTNEDDYSHSIHITGKIKKLSQEDYDYFEEYFVDLCGFTQAQFEAMTLPYYIDVNMSLEKGFKYIYVAVVVGGIVLVIWGILRIINAAGGKSLKKFIRDYENAGFTESAIENDVASAVSYTRHDDTKLGRLCFYYNLNSAGPRAIPNNKIMWAYQNTTTHRTNGIKTGTTYSVMFYVEGYKDAFNIGVPNEQTAQDILKRINDTLPWVVVGYSDELRKLYNRERDQFLNLRYNTVEHVAVEPGFAGFNS